MWDTPEKIKRFRLIFNICVLVLFAVIAVFAYLLPQYAEFLFKILLGGILLVTMAVNTILGRKQQELQK